MPTHPAPLKGIALIERRRHPRIAGRVSIGFQANGRVTMVRTRDFSVSGACLEVSGVEVGSSVVVYVMPPDSNQATRLSGKVVRASGGTTAIEFEPVGGEVRQALERFLSRLDPRAAPEDAPSEPSLEEAFDPAAIQRAIRRESQERLERTAIARQLQQLAQQALDQGRTQTAIELLNEAIKLAPGNASLHNDLGAAYFQAGDVSRAAKELEKALLLQPDSA